MRESEIEDSEVAAVEMDVERERERLPFVKIEVPDWFENRVDLWAG